MDTKAVTAQAPRDYLLQLADNALILGQRNSEWCGHGPALEEDIAMANISLDLIGQARMLYQYVAEISNAETTEAGTSRNQNGAVSEDRLAYFRNAHEFRNYTLLELPHHGPLAPTASGERDYASTIVRNFLYSALMNLLWERLQNSADPRLAAIAAKSLKEVRYHLRHAQSWLLRLGDGSAESKQRMQRALDHLFPYTLEFWSASTAEATAVGSASGVHPVELRAEWDRMVDAALAEAKLVRPAAPAHVPQGKQGVHSEHLGHLLAEMQSVARAHPDARW